MTESTKQPTQKNETKAVQKKKDNTLKIVLIVVGGVVGLMILAGVGMAIFVGSIFKEATKNVEVNKDNGSVTIKTDEGEATASYGNDTQLPDGYPSDVPIYEPSNIVYAIKTDGKNYSVTAKTNDERTAVADYYKSELPKQGWTLDREFSYSQGTSITYNKADRSVTVSVTNPEYTTTEGKTTINITLNQDNEYTQ